jgi:hypothetical protein
MKTVKEQFDEVYEECGKPGTALEMSTLENECYRYAVSALDPEDQDDIRLMISHLVNCKPQIRGMGETSALELLAKLGIFYNGVKAL